VDSAAARCRGKIWFEVVAFIKLREFVEFVVDFVFDAAVCMHRTLKLMIGEIPIIERLVTLQGQESRSRRGTPGAIRCRRGPGFSPSIGTVRELLSTHGRPAAMERLQFAKISTRVKSQ